MKNGEKYKSAEERLKALNKWCDSGLGLSSSKRCLANGCIECALKWLEREAEEEQILPCPCCGGECVVSSHSEGHEVKCRSRYCYVGKTFESKDEAIAAHNRVARAVMAKK